MAKEWLFILVVVVAALTLVLYFGRHSAEGFDAISDFVKQQDTYFHKTAPDGIPINPGMQVNTVNPALQTPDLHARSAQDTDYTGLFYENPLAKYAEQDATFCRGVAHPRNLPPVAAGSRIGCGWYLVPSDIGASVGVLGTRDAPFIRTGLPPGGTWIWNRAEAIKQEDMKLCKNLKICDAIEGEAYRNVCGFCDRLGHGVPINSNGTEKYPDDANACGSTLYTSSTQCARADVPYTTDDGFDCGTVGRASADGSLRLYTSAECDAFGGILQQNGVCKRPDGTSISYDCRILNAPVSARVGADSVVTSTANVCVPVGGKLTANCLASLAKTVGCTMNGAILKMIYKYKTMDSTDRLAIQKLAEVGVSVPESILGEGSVTVAGATNAYTAVYGAMRHARPVIQEAAKWLCIGTTNFDPCDYSGGDTGPFSTTCLQQQFRKAGCQAAGSMYPTEASATAYANKSWSEINSEFTGVYTKMQSGKASEQDEAVRKCLGIQYRRTPPLPCDNPGMEYLYYSWNAGDTLSTPLGTYAAYMGRWMSDRGFRSIEPGTGMIEPAQRADKVVVKVRGYVNAPETVRKPLTIYSDDGIRVYVNKQAVIDDWRDRGTTENSALVTFEQNKRTDLEMHWYENAGGAVLDARGVIEDIRPYIYMPFPKTAPVVAFDFFTGSFADAHGTLVSTHSGLTYTQDPTDSRSGARFSNRAFLQILTPIRTRAIKTYTMSVYWSALGVEAPVLFNMCKNITGKNGANFGLYGGEGRADSLRFSYFKNMPDGYNVVASGGNATPVGRWVHYAIVWDSDFAGAKVYIDGVLRVSNRNAGLFGGAAFPDDILNYLTLGRPASLLGNTAESATHTFRFGENVTGTNNMYVIKKETATGRTVASNINAGMRYLTYNGSVYMYTASNVWYQDTVGGWALIRNPTLLRALNAAVLNEGAVESSQGFNGVMEYFHMYDRCLNVSEINEERTAYISNYKTAVDTYGAAAAVPTFVPSTQTVVQGIQF